MGKKSDVDSHCSGAVCDAVGFEAQEDAKSAATISTIGFIAGGVLLAGAVALVVTAPKSKSALVIAPANAGMKLLLSF
jgi:hypothetical protein